MEVAVVLAALPTGPYVSVFEALPVVVLLMVWSKLLAWADKDSIETQLPREMVNTGMFAGLVGGVFCFFCLGLNFFAGLGAFLGFFAADAGVFLYLRNKKVGLADLKQQIKDAFTPAAKVKEIKATKGEVLVLDKKGKAFEPPGAEDPDRKLYEAAQTVLNLPLRKGAERIDIVPTSDASAVSFVVDGVRHPGPTLDKASGSAAITYLKIAAGIDVAEKRKPQAGAFRTNLEGSKRDLDLQTKGSSAGESAMMVIDPKKRHLFNPDTLSFSPEQLKIVKDIIAQQQGVVLLTAPNGQGLTALEYGILRGHDAFIQHLITVEKHQELDLEGVTQNALPPSATGADEAKQVAWVTSQEPDVVLVGNIEDPASARDVATYGGNENRRVYVGMRDGNTFEALKHWRKLVGDDKLAMKNLKLIIAGRTLRKLCEACKIGYAPDPSLLKKLNMDPNKVTRLYQARTTPMKDDKGNPVPCNFCNDMAFKGRAGVYELFVIDDEVRELVLSNASDNQLKAAFRKQKGRLLQEMALALVEKGDTSVNEVQRVMKPPSTGAAPGASGGSAPARASAPRPAPASGAAQADGA